MRSSYEVCCLSSDSSLEYAVLNDIINSLYFDEATAIFNQKHDRKKGFVLGTLLTRYGKKNLKISLNNVFCGNGY